MCTGRAPFRASTPMAVLKRVCDDTPRPVQEVNPDIPDWLAGIVVRLHAKDPARRYQAAAEVADVLGQHLARYQQPNAATAQSPTTRPRRWGRWIAAAALLLAGIGLAIFFLDPELRAYLAGPIRSGLAAGQLSSQSPFSIDGDSPPESLRLLKSFGADDIKLYVWGSEPETEWMIPNDSNIFGTDPRVVHLCDFRGSIPQEGELVFRAKIRTEGNSIPAPADAPPAPIVAALYMGFTSKYKCVDTTGWSEYEVRYPLHLLRQSGQQTSIPLNLGLWGRGTVWIKAVQLLHAPCPPHIPPALREGETLIKEFLPSDVPISKPFIGPEGNWQLESFREREGWWFWGNLERIRLYELHDFEFQGCELILRTKMKTFNQDQGIYPSIYCDAVDGGGINSPKPEVMPERDTNWTTYETRLEIPQGFRPALVRINLEKWIRNLMPTLGGTGFKDMVLVKAPLRPAAMQKSKEARRLKSFSPASDTPLDKPDKLEDNAWRFDHSTANANRKVRLFELRDALPEGGEIIYRAKLKTQTDQRDSGASLMLGEEPFSPFEVSHGVAEEFGLQVTGQKQEWTDCEVRYPVQGFFHTDPPVIPINLSIYGSAAVWIKDIEIWHVPADPPLRRPGEKLIKRFGPKDKPIRSDYARSADGWQFEVGLKAEVLRLFTIRDPEVKDGKFLFRAKMRTKGTYPSVNLQLTQRFPDQTFKGDVQRSTKAEGTTRWTDYEVWITLPPGQGPIDLELAIEAKGTDIQGNTYTVAIKDVEFLRAAPDK
jgi:hypothetical protein